MTVRMGRGAADKHKFISDYLLKVTVELTNMSKAVTFVGYAPTQPSLSGANNPFERYRAVRLHRCHFGRHCTANRVDGGASKVSNVLRAYG